MAKPTRRRGTNASARGAQRGEKSRAAARSGPASVKRRDGEPKREATRRALLEHALALFQKRGVDATTMRDIAKAASMSLGAAYYYFPSKEALVFAYYQDNQQQLDERVQPVGTLRERLGQLFHAKLESIRPHRKMLSSIVAHLVNPGDPLSAFSAQTRSVRDRSIAQWTRELEGAVPPAAVPIVANALWLLVLAAMLVYINDDTPDERRTHALVDDGLDMLVPLLRLLATPPGAAIVDRISGALGRAGIGIAPA